MKKETLQFIVMAAILSTLVVLLVVLGIFVSKRYLYQTTSPPVTTQSESIMITTATAMATDEATNLLLSALEKQLSGLDIKRVHELIGSDVSEIAATENKWLEADLMLAIENAVDQGILAWVEEKIETTANKQGYPLSKEESRNLRDQFYFSDWLEFMSYYEIASLKNSGTLVIEQP